MRRKKKLRVMAIEANSPDEFNRQINEVLDEAEDAEIIFDSSGWLRAYVRYCETIAIPEDMRDAYEMRGEYHHCGECPYYTDPTDRRRKYGTCELGEAVNASTNACNLFYKMHNDGTLKSPKKIIRR